MKSWRKAMIGTRIREQGRSVTKGQELITNSLFSHLQNAVLSEAEGTKN